MLKQLNEKWDAAVKDYRFSPLSALNNTMLAEALPFPLYISTAGLDPLRDDGRLLVARLNRAREAAKLPTNTIYHRHYDELPHSIYDKLAPWGLEPAGKAVKDVTDHFNQNPLL